MLFDGAQRMIKLLLAVVLMIASAMAAAAYVQLNPFIFGLIVLAILGFGVSMVGRLAEPLMEGRPAPWGGGEGIYLSPDDKWGPRWPRPARAHRLRRRPRPVNG
jgi:hypothetical protein